MTTSHLVGRQMYSMRSTASVRTQWELIPLYKNTRHMTRVH